jgi:hypothetical protein
MGHIVSKLGHTAKYGKTLLTLKRLLFDPNILKIGQNVVLLIFRSSSNVGNLGSKTRSHSLDMENPVETTVLNQISWKLVNKVEMMISWSSLNIHHLWGQKLGHTA